MMMCSNFAWLTTQNNSSCAAHVWLISLGFTLMFAPIFVKTFRLWRIFESASLQVTVITITQLWGAVLVAMVAEAIYLGIWLGTTGMPSEIVVVDPIRPSLNLAQCNLSLAWTWVSFGLKAAFLVLGCLLVYLTRNIPKIFNEAEAVGNSMYILSLSAVIVIPILATKSIDSTTQALIRSFAIVLVVVSCSAVLMVPKLFTSAIKTLTSAVSGPSWKGPSGKSERSSNKLGTQANSSNHSENGAELAQTNSMIDTSAPSPKYEGREKNAI